MVLRLSGIAQDAHVGFSSLRVILNDDSELTLPLMCVGVYFNLRCILQSSVYTSIFGVYFNLRWPRPTDRERRPARRGFRPQGRNRGISIGPILSGRSGAPYLAKSDI